MTGGGGSALEMRPVDRHYIYLHQRRRLKGEFEKKQAIMYHHANNTCCWAAWNDAGVKCMYGEHRVYSGLHSFHPSAVTTSYFGGFVKVCYYGFSFTAILVAITTDSNNIIISQYIIYRFVSHTNSKIM